MDEVDLNGSDEGDGRATVPSLPFPQAFSLPALVEHFAAALTEDGGDVRMVPYLAAFKEIVKFLELLGTVFHFVITDVTNKIAILEKYAGVTSELSSSRSASSVASPVDAAQYYNTVRSMVEHEVATGIVADKRRQPSGCRTLLRLHRALEYTLLFFRRLHQSNDGEKLSSLSSSVYSETLSKHHPWMIRKAVSVAMYAMPSRLSLFEKLTSTDGDDRGNLVALLLRAADAGRPIYDNVHATFAKRDLLELP